MSWKHILKTHEDDDEDWGQYDAKEFTEENIGEDERFEISLSAWEIPAQVDESDKTIAMKIFEEIKAAWDDNEPVPSFYNNTIYIVKMVNMYGGGLAATDGNLPDFINDILEDNNVDISGRGKFKFTPQSLQYTG